jgi:hypothetical protein
MISFSRSVLEEESLRPGQAPTADQVKSMGVLGLAFGGSGRIAAVNDIGANLTIPKGGWPGAQAQLIEKGDARLSGVFAIMAGERSGQAIASHLADAARSTHANVILTFVTSQREHASSITAMGTNKIDSFWEGGLDHLWTWKDHLGLPESMTKEWEKIKPYANPDAHPKPGKVAEKVHPAWIPARDQVVAYGATIGKHFDEFKGHVNHWLRADAGAALANMSRIGVIVWQAYAFLAHGGNVFDPKRSLHSQIGQHFGMKTALGYIIHAARAKNPAAIVDLNQVFLDPHLNHSAWVQSAKVRAVETLFLERLFAAVSQLVMVGQ